MFARRNCKVLSRGEVPDGVYLLLEGSLSVYVAQKVCVWRVACPCQIVTCYKAIIATVGQQVTQGLAPQEMSQVITSFKCAVVSVRILHVGNEYFYS